MFVPIPNWPKELLPQHFTPPAVVTAHVCAPPAEMAAAPLLKPLTFTGVLLSVVVPLPNWPSLLWPQHFTPPAVVRAQVWPPPADTAATPLVRPLTSTGVLLPAPQHFTPPAVVIAHV